MTPFSEVTLRTLDVSIFNNNHEVAIAVFNHVLLCFLVNGISNYFVQFETKKRDTEFWSTLCEFQSSWDYAKMIN